MSENRPYLPVLEKIATSLQSIANSLKDNEADSENTNSNNTGQTAKKTKNKVKKVTNADNIHQALVEYHKKNKIKFGDAVYLTQREISQLSGVNYTSISPAITKLEKQKILARTIVKRGRESGYVLNANLHRN